MSKDSLLSKFDFLLSMPNLIIFSLFVVGAVVMVWVGSLAINDMNIWNKDLGTIFFGSRTGEGISLGIGMTLINYVYVAIALFGAGTVLFVRNHMQASSDQKIIMKPSQKTSKPKQAKTGTPSKSSNKEEPVVAGEERFFSGCLHHFGYLSSRPKEDPVPPECILCQRLGDCMLATVYVKETSK